MTTDEPARPAAGRPAPSARDGGVWLRDEGRAPRRPEPLTLERIVVAAVDELDAHGAERLTMRRLAGRLEVTSTALYWHVTTKEDLLDLAVDRILGETPLPDDDGDPRRALRALLTDWRATMLAHPWSPSLLARPLLGPHSLARMEFLQAMLSRAGLAGIHLAAATRTLADFVVGAAVIDATWRRLDASTVLPRVRARLAAAGDEYSTLRTSGLMDGAWSDDDLFDTGLERVLDTVVGRP